MSIVPRQPLHNMLRLSRRFIPNGTRHPQLVLPIRSLQTAAGSIDTVSSDVVNDALRPQSRYAHSPQYDPSRAPRSPAETNLSTTPVSLHRKGKAPSKPSTIPSKVEPISPSVRENLPLLAAQGPHYITVHIHGRPYLVTAGDTIQLPFLMHGVSPGDVLRLNRASILGSRDWTLKAGVRSNKQPSTTTLSSNTPSSTATTAEPIIGNRTDEPPTTPYPDASNPSKPQAGANAGLMRNQWGHYLDDRLFVCRAVVMGVEAEPMRVLEKTKRRQRRVKRVKSKHRYTVLRIRELTVRASAEEVEAAEPS